MTLRALLITALGSAVGCAGATPPVTGPTAEAPCSTSPMGSAPSTPADAPDLRIEIQVVSVPSPRAAFAITIAAGRLPDVTRLVLPGVAPASVLELRAASEGQPVGVRAVAADAAGPTLSGKPALGDASALADKPAQGSEIHVERAAGAAITVHYHVDLPTEPADRDTPSAHADPNRAVILGDLLALPPGEPREAFDVELVLGTLDGRPEGGASTLAARPVSRRATTRAQLASLIAFVGSPGTAEMHADEGDDHALWFGYTSFDARWMAAESAGLRSAVDRYVGAKLGGDHAIVLVSVRRPEIPFVIRPLPRALWISADLSAPWDAAARLRVGAHFAQRHVGGALAVGTRGVRPDPAGLFWHEGVARVVGREVAFELGLIGFDDLASDVNAALAEEALSVVAGRPSTELEAIAAEEDEAAVEARRLLAARGVLWASALAAEVDSTGAPTLRSFLRAAFKQAASRGEDVWSMPTLTTFVADALGPAGREVFTAQIARGQRATLTNSAVGTCHTLENQKVARYELGLRIDAPAEGPRTVAHVERGSRAEAAGLAAGDVVESATYVPGRIDVPVKMTLRRAGQSRVVEFLPRGREAMGRAFVRKRGARDERCVRIAGAP